MWSLTVVFIDIALHRRGPQDVPASALLLSFVLAVYLLIAVIALRIDDAGGEALIGIVLDAGFFLAAVWILLNVLGRRAQFLPAATALVGTGAVLSTLQLPLLAWNSALDLPLDQATAPRLLFLVLYFWSLDISGFIVSKAIDKPYIVGVAIVVVYEAVSISLRGALSPAAA